MYEGLNILDRKVMEVNMLMNDKPLHYDGSALSDAISTSNSNLDEPFVLTDEMRKNISGNPFGMETKE